MPPLKIHSALPRLWQHVYAIRDERESASHPWRFLRIRVRGRFWRVPPGETPEESEERAVSAWCQAASLRVPVTFQLLPLRADLLARGGEHNYRALRWHEEIERGETPARDTLWVCLRNTALARFDANPKTMVLESEVLTSHSTEEIARNIGAISALESIHKAQFWHTLLEGAGIPAHAESRDNKLAALMVAMRSRALGRSFGLVDKQMETVEHGAHLAPEFRVHPNVMEYAKLL